jgi:hypothetical protein
MLCASPLDWHLCLMVSTFLAASEASREARQAAVYDVCGCVGHTVVLSLFHGSRQAPVRSNRRSLPVELTCSCWGVYCAACCGQLTAVLCLFPPLCRYWVSKGERKGANPMSVSNSCWAACMFSQAFSEARTLCVQQSNAIVAVPTREHVRMYFDFRFCSYWLSRPTRY